MDDVAAERSPAPDADLLAGVRSRRSTGHLFLAVFWTAGCVVQVVRDNTGNAVLWGLGAACWAWLWWSGSAPSLREVADDGLRVRRGLRTRLIPRSDVQDVQASYGTGYGLVLTLRDADPVTLAGTAPRHSVAAAQAAALRRWAGLPE
ncbi:protein of unknown function [Modestobacter italicus]|uniref:Low molecular weight protein antigen 6 PH domain-containing protein n=1 Tax=Modestobacter italicus (strain DSM 44449 / CECT 9708 / BC 501) TaxID=2732864 RepID=I4F5J8_MODI5|nr:PH domain-containing protein [Modestobacter marinus]CCH90911.1 protein of unknown function [Modestobacter marinus]